MDKGTREKTIAFAIRSVDPRGKGKDLRSCRLGRAGTSKRVHFNQAHRTLFALATRCAQRNPTFLKPPVFQTNSAFHAPSRFSNTPIVFSYPGRFGAADWHSGIQRFQKRWVSLHH